MKKIKSFFSRALSYLFGITLLGCSAANALNSDVARPHLRADYNVDSCSDLLKECFTLQKPEEKSSCLYDAAKSFFCENGSLGELAYSRWSLVSAADEGQDTNSDSLNPKLVDMTCIQNFDNQMSAALIKGPITEQAGKDLALGLNRCVKPSELETIHP